jgi:hypothetical protein
MHPESSALFASPLPWWRRTAWSRWWHQWRDPYADVRLFADHPAHRDEDTVAAWPPEAARVLCRAERSVHTALVAALPDHWVWPQVPLSRLVRVPVRRSYTEWIARIGLLSADFAVCDLSSRPVAVVLMPAEGMSKRAQRRRERLCRVLNAAGVPVLEWDAARWTSTQAVRAAFNSARPEQTLAR